MNLTDMQRDSALRAPVGLAAGDPLGASDESRTSGRYSPRRITRSGFPHRRVIEDAIVQLLRERGGSVKIRTRLWNIYDELGERLGVPIRARQRPTSTTGEPAWRPEVGFARKNLELRGVIAPTLLSGRGVWQLAQH
jgi:hypothetical protein